MRKYIFGKKVSILTEDEAFLSFRSVKNFEAFYTKLEDNSVLVNFRGEFRNVNAFCKDKNYCYGPDFDTKTISIRSVHV
jgi:hypothetical protein